MARSPTDDEIARAAERIRRAVLEFNAATQEAFRHGVEVSAHFISDERQVSSKFKTIEIHKITKRL
jgi:hypothetical protein